MLNKTLLGSAAVIMTMVGAQAADLPSKKAAPATYVKICDAYGAGFYTIPGTDTCVKVGGYVRVDYDYRPERKDTVGIGTNSKNAPASLAAAYSPIIATAQVAGAAGAAATQAIPVSGAAIVNASGTDNTTSGFYNRGTIQLDARTPTSMGVARTFMALRMETGSGLQAKASTGPSLEAAFIQWAGFTMGQGAQPASFMSSWAYNTAYWGGWPSGVRQLTYTAVLGGGFSATFGITDSHNYDTVSTKRADAAGTVVKIVPESLDTPGYNGIVYVGNVRYDQSWGAVQLFGAAHTGGDLTGGTATTILSDGLTKKSGWALGIGASYKLPMLAAGDEIQVTFVYNDRVQNIIGDAGINTPSSAAYGSSPIGGPAVSYANGTGWVAGAQLRHYWTSAFRSQVYASYTSRTQHDTSTTFGGTGTAYSLGKAFIYSPAKDFDIGLEFNYIRAEWDEKSIKSIKYTAPVAAPSTGVYGSGWAGGSYGTSNLVTKLRIQRNF